MMQDDPTQMPNFDTQEGDPPPPNTGVGDQQPDTGNVPSIGQQVGDASAAFATALDEYAPHAQRVADAEAAVSKAQTRLSDATATRITSARALHSAADALISVIKAVKTANPVA